MSAVETLYDLPATQKLGSAINRWARCRKCSYVQVSHDTRTPWVCSTCGYPDELGPNHHFSGPVNRLLDLMQLQKWLKVTEPVTMYSWDFDPAEIGTVVLYCTLHEVLQRQLLWDLLQARGVSEAEISGQLDNAKGFTRRQKLFSQISGQELQEVVSELGEWAKQLWSLAKDIKDCRNDFLHRGQVWSKPLAPEAINSTQRLLKVYADLHNKILPVVLNEADGGVTSFPNAG